MASNAFTPATAAITNIFHGVAQVGTRLYGSGSFADIGMLSAEAEVEINLIGEKAEQQIHQLRGPINRWWTDAMVEVLFRLAKTDSTIIAFLFGKGSADVTDNAASTPKNKRVAYGDSEMLTEYKLQIQRPQTKGTAPLYDIFVIPRCQVIPGNSQFRFGRAAKGDMPIKFESLADPSEATYPGCHLYFEGEYA